jgi:hypothetical protein
MVAVMYEKWTNYRNEPATLMSLIDMAQTCGLCSLYLLIRRD